MSLRHAFAAVMLFAASIVAPHAARAAESYDNCTGFIDAVPATISTQGVWCLRKDLSTNISSGNAIEIVANNVTIDCNDFKLGGLAAGDASLAFGVHAYGWQNITVRHCSIRGFYAGIVLIYGGGHLVEDNRLDNNLGAGISTGSGSGTTNSLVRHNRIFDTGGDTATTVQNVVFGIVADGDVIDNTVNGVSPLENGAELTDSINVYGIADYSVGAQISGNQISDVGSKGTASHEGHAYGISASGLESVSDNRIAGISASSYVAAYGIGSEIHGIFFCTGNTVASVQGTAIIGCQAPDPDDNLVSP